MLGSSFGMFRWRKEGLVVGERIRASAKAWVCRWVERREPSFGRWVGREVHCEVVVRSLVDEAGSGVVR